MFRRFMTILIFCKKKKKKISIGKTKANCKNSIFALSLNVTKAEFGYRQDKKYLKPFSAFSE